MQQLTFCDSHVQQKLIYEKYFLKWEDNFLNKNKDSWYKKYFISNFFPWNKKDFYTYFRLHFT